MQSKHYFRFACLQKLDSPIIILPIVASRNKINKKLMRHVVAIFFEVPKVLNLRTEP